MIKNNKLEEHNNKINELLQELDYYQNVVFAQNFILFLSSHVCNWHKLKEKTTSPIEIHHYYHLLTEQSLNNLQKYISNDFISNYLLEKSLNVYFKINHKFYNQDEQTNNYKVEFYFYKKEKLEKSNIVSFCCLPTQLLNDSSFKNLTFKEENSKRFFEFNYKNIETLFSNLLDNKNIKSQYFFELFQDEYSNSKKQELNILKI